MCYTTSVANDVQAVVAGLKVIVQGNFHVVELDFHAVQKSFVACCARGNFVQSVDHFDDAIQNAFGNYQTQVAGNCLQRWSHEGFLNATFRTALAADEVAEALNDDATTQHVGKFCNAFAVAVAILERFGKVLGNKQCKVGVFSVELWVFVAMAVYRDDAVGVFRYNCAVWVHAERANLVLVLGGFVHNLAFVQFVGDVLENGSGQFNTHANVHTVGLCFDLQTFANFFHPFATATANGHNAVLGSVGLCCRDNVVQAVLVNLDGFYRR